jgi:hypothetical protein
MELFGIGPLELLFILLIALIVLGPRDMVKAGNALGRLLRKTILSPTWIKIQRDIRSLPYQMMREAGLEEEDLRVNIGVSSEPGEITKSTSGISNQAEVTQPPPPAENSIGQSPEVPNEWLGLPVPELEEYSENPPLEEQPALSEWTSAPVIETSANDPLVAVRPDDNPNQAKDPS